MNFLKFAGVTKGDDGAREAADLIINRILAVGQRAHARLRDKLRNDPVFGSTICKALGCQTEGCAEPTSVIMERINQVPGVIQKIAAENPTRPSQYDELGLG